MHRRIFMSFYFWIGYYCLGMKLWWTYCVLRRDTENLFVDIGVGARRLLESVPYLRVHIEMADVFDGPGVYISNHASALDHLLVTAALCHTRYRTLMAHDRFKDLFWGAVRRRAGHIAFDRRNRQARHVAFESARQWVAQGGALLVYPEGRRSPESEVDTFRSGAFRVASEFAAPIHGFLIQGTGIVLPRRHILLKCGTLSLRRLFWREVAQGENPQRLCDQVITLYRKQIRKTSAVVCDLDGVLFANNRRLWAAAANLPRWSEADWNSLALRSKRYPLHGWACDLIAGCARTGQVVLFVSARRGTDAMLNALNHVIARHFPTLIFELHLRQPTDTEPDADFKKKIYHERIAERFCIAMAIDDQAEVGQMWQTLGIPTLNFAYARSAQELDLVIDETSAMISKVSESIHDIQETHRVRKTGSENPISTGRASHLGGAERPNAVHSAGG